MKLVIHADASTVPGNPGNIGIAFHAAAGGKTIVSWAYGGYGTSNQGEILAIGFALEVLKPVRQDYVLIHTDSMYALRTLNDEWPAGPNRGVVAAVQALAAPWIETVRLVHGHAGLEGNEAADFAARHAGLAGKTIMATPVYIPPGLASQAVLHLERVVMPGWTLLRRRNRRLSEQIMDIHIKIRRGLRSLDQSLEMLVLDAEDLLEKEGAMWRAT